MGCCLYAKGVGRMTKKEKIEWDYFIDKSNGRRRYNTVCRKCKNDCKQSFRAILVNCPRFTGKQSKREKLP